MSLFPQPHSARGPGAPTDPLAWLALGDSYTIGEGVAPEARWPSRVAATLHARGIRLAPPRLVATTGWTAAELLAGMEHANAWPPSQSHALVTLAIGVNDQYRGHSLEAFAPSYAECLRRAIALAGGRPERVLCVSIPDWGVTPFAADRDRTAIAREIDGYNAHERARAHATGARWCDVTARARRHGADPRFLAADGLHPGPAAYAEWAAAIAPVAARILRGGEPAQP